MSGGSALERKVWSSWRQGDVFMVECVPTIGESGVIELSTPHGVMMLSQTCDVVQSSKETCVVAVVVAPGEAELANVEKGRVPLQVSTDVITGDGSAYTAIADVSRLVTISKATLELSNRDAVRAKSPSDLIARKLSSRIARAYGRFAFPDEIYPTFLELKKKFRSVSGKSGALAKVLERVAAIRVSSDQWDAPDRQMVLHFILPEDEIAPEDDLDLNWRNGDEELARASLQRLSEVIISEKYVDADMRNFLWQSWGSRVVTELVNSEGDEVSSVRAEMYSVTEFSYQDMMNSESLDFETLSGH